MTLALLTPYVAFWVPHELGGSGVLATLVAGVYVGSKGIELIPSNTRLQALFFWDFVIDLITGAMFLLTGLQARMVLDGHGEMGLGRLLLYGFAISLVAIVVRFVWVFPATYLPRWVLPHLRARDPSPRWPDPFLVALTGVRGVVSLAAALAIPLTTAAGAPFPRRDLILFVTFGVIVVTLIGQGLMLPAVVRWLALPHDAEDERQRAEQRAVVARHQPVIEEQTAGERPQDVGAEPLRHHRHQDRRARPGPAEEAGERHGDGAAEEDEQEYDDGEAGHAPVRYSGRPRSIQRPIAPSMPRYSRPRAMLAQTVRQGNTVSFWKTSHELLVADLARSRTTMRGRRFRT